VPKLRKYINICQTYAEKTAGFFRTRCTYLSLYLKLLQAKTNVRWFRDTAYITSLFAAPGAE